MKIRKQWLGLALLLCVAMTAAATMPSSLAYVAANSNTVHNSFRIEHLPPQDITVPVRVHKTVLSLGDESIGPGGFSFHLMDLNTGKGTVITSFADGWAKAQLPFTAEDVGQTYRYRLYGIDTGREHVTYDDTIHDIGITIFLNQRHEISAELTMNGKAVTEIAAEFVNLYESTTLPDTSDHDQLLLWLATLLLSSMGLVLRSKKRTLYRRP